MAHGEDPKDPTEPELRASGFTGTWSVEGGVVPVWVDADDPPPLYDSNKNDPLPSLLDRLGLRLVPPEGEKNGEKNG